jgi:hypothetical protein
MKLGLALVALAGVVLAVWLLRRTESSPAAGEGIPDDDPDGQVLKQLVVAGSDLSKPHQVEFFLYFPDEERASRAYRELATEGFSGKVDRAATGPGWLCFVTKQIVPTHATMLGIRKRMEGLATAGGGEYDGWGTPVSK